MRSTATVPVAGNESRNSSRTLFCDGNIHVDGELSHGTATSVLTTSPVAVGHRQQPVVGLLKFVLCCIASNLVTPALLAPSRGVVGPAEISALLAQSRAVVWLVPSCIKFLISSVITHGAPAGMFGKMGHGFGSTTELRC
jgi:hypothetical protein